MLVFVILVLIGGSLFDSSCIFIIDRVVWAPPDHVLLHVSHSLEASVSGFIFGSLNDDDMHVLQFQVSCFPE